MAAKQEFTYVAMDRSAMGPDGRATWVEGKMTAPSESAVRSTLLAQGNLEIVKIAPTKTSSMTTEFSLSQILGRVSAKELAKAYRTMASLTRAGVGLVAAVDAVARSSKDLLVQETFTQIVEDIRGGIPLQDSMRKFPNIFSSVDIELIGVGVQGGQLEKVLERVATNAENRNQIVRKIRSALTMPAITLVLAMGVAVFMAVYFVPMSTGVITSINPDAELPAATRAMMVFADNVWMLGLIPVAAIGWWLLSTKVLRYQQDWQRFKSLAVLKFPVFGPLTRLMATASISRTLHMMLEAGMPMTRSLGLLAPATKNVLYRESIERMRVLAETGKPLSDAMSEYPKLYDFAFTRMVEVGEDSGDLVRALDSIATEREQVLAVATESLQQTIQPLALVVVGAVVGTVVLATYGPVMTLATTI